MPQLASAGSQHAKTARDSHQNPITSETQSAQLYRTSSQHAYGSQVPSATQESRADGRQMHSDAVQTETPVSQVDDLLPTRLQQVMFVLQFKVCCTLKYYVTSIWVPPFNPQLPPATSISIMYCVNPLALCLIFIFNCPNDSALQICPKS